MNINPTFNPILSIIAHVTADALEEIVTAATFLVGRDYPNASSLIPYFDTIEAQIDEMAQSLDGECSD